MLMGSLQERLCWVARNCFMWLLSPACITSSMWKVPGSLESSVMTMDRSGSLVERKIPPMITEQGENCLCRSGQTSRTTQTIQMSPCAGPSAGACAVQREGHKAGHSCEFSAEVSSVLNSPFALYSPWTGFFYLRT